VGFSLVKPTNSKKELKSKAVFCFCFFCFFTYPQAVQVDEFAYTSEQIWIHFALHHLLSNGSSAETNPSLTRFNFWPKISVHNPY